MGWLDAGNGLFHFVLAREDFYYTDSLCRLSLRQNLEWILREKGYHTIFRAESKRDHWEIRSNTERIVLSGSTKEEFRNLMEERYESFLCDSHKKAAFLIRCDVFVKLFSKEMGELCEKWECLPDREGIFVILCPRDAEVFCRLFQKAEGILKTDLFLQVRKSFENIKDKESCISVLQKHLGECFCVFPDITRSDIFNMLLRNKVLGRWKIDCKKIEKLADFLFFYLRSDEFQKEVPNFLPRNQKMPLAMIEKALLKKGMLEKTEGILEQTQERVEEQKRRWAFLEKEVRQQENATFDILKKEGSLDPETELEVPLCYIMAVQYRDGRRKSFFYPGFYRISDGDKIGKVVLIRKKDRSFLAQWKVSEILCNQSETKSEWYQINGTCHVKILSYGKGMTRYLFQETSFRKEWTFQELISEKNFFAESLRERIQFIVRELFEEGISINRQTIEENLNKKWIYENGMYFFQFFVKEIKEETRQQEKRKND